MNDDFNPNQYYAEHFYEEKNTIDNKILKIKELICSCNPLDLLKFCAGMHFIYFAYYTPESEYSTEQNDIMRVVEYVQSILASSNNKYDTDNEQTSVVKYFEILTLIMDLYTQIYTFSVFLFFHLKKENGELDDDIISYICEAYNASLIRGDRYQIHDIEHLKKLLLPHGKVIIELFQITASELIEGLEKLQYSLTYAIADIVNNTEDLLLKFQKIHHLINDKKINGINDDKEKEECLSLTRLMFSDSFFDVKKITGWNDKILNCLSFEINEYGHFFDDNYSGWPIRDLPVQKRPFIKINGVSYCFDYNNLFDNFYRIMQKTITREKPSYERDWNIIQKKASEQMVVDLFEKLLPGCVILKDNFYPSRITYENDIIVIYEDTLFIIEVKAGSFTYTPAITDYRAHITSFKKLLEYADFQCVRTLDYINNNKEAAFYYHNKKLKTIIKKSDYNEIYTFCITIENLGPFSTKADKLSFIKLNSSTISISIDDLRVYSEYFNSPLYFLHYLKQRKFAAGIKKLNLYEELEHLGLYIDYNQYTIQIDKHEADYIAFPDSTTDLDKYFVSLDKNKIFPQKPVQVIPYRVKEIVDFLDKNNVKGRTVLSNFLLDFGGKSKEGFHAAIEEVLKKQRRNKAMNPVLSFGDLRFCLFINQPDIPNWSEKHKSDYIDSKILFNNLGDYVSINLFYNNLDVLENISYSIHSKENIPKS